MNDACPTCGSDCNERDELTKAEREIGKLTQERDEARAERERLRSKCAEADQLFHEAIATGRQIQAECERLRADAEKYRMSRIGVKNPGV